MNYKRLIKSKNIRIKILSFLDIIPNKMMIKIQYFIKNNRKLNLKRPKRFTEKLQWLKLYYRNPLMPICADKYDVRQHIRNIGLNEILNECYGIYGNPSDIDFDSLPDSFVLKDTLGSGGEAIIIVKDKNQINKNSLLAQMNSWVNYPLKRKDPGREWVYEGRKHRIIIEKFIESDSQDGGLLDYKFLCFNGEPKYLYIIGNRVLGESAGLAIYDIEFNKVKYLRADEKILDLEIVKPKNFDKMVEYARKISENFPHARIDFYDVKEKIIFGEITFFDGSGYMQYNPDEFDFILGDLLNIEEIS